MSRRPSVLLFTDQAPGSQHSAIQGIFARHLRPYADVQLVFFAREATQPHYGSGETILPWRYRRSAWLWKLFPPMALDTYDFIIVRNLFPVLAGILAVNPRHARVGFWESFPHSFRRVHEARRTGHARLRKTAEYAIRRIMEDALLARCDFYLPITATMRSRFRPLLRCPVHPLPMGVDPETLPPTSDRTKEAPLKLVYIGAIDPLRRVDRIIQALENSSADFRFDIYTASQNEMTQALAHLADPRIRLLPPLSREALLARLPQYHLGVSLIPCDPLYEVASPTKTMEYYAMGLPALMTPLPEHLALFPADTGFYTDMTSEAITATVECLARMPREMLAAMGERGRSIVLQTRGYDILARELYEFLMTLGGRPVIPRGIA